ncbi:hypothetical protein Taro_030530 [Colocasia esculenta]|uniref:Uncharacterized protein n=1 Tax=Colocasia esculenta TaxID=4460 RepID=A0A843W0H4_COLES|nr:hypothetical protein [Colocasia esculenta]
MVAPVSRELLCLSGSMPRCCFRIVFDSAGSNFVVLISGLLRRCPLVEVHRLAAVFWWCFPELFVVVLVRVPLPLGLLLCSLKSSAMLPPSFKVFVVWLVADALPSRLRCIAWLPYVLVRFSRTIGCCPGEVHSQECSGLFLLVVVLPQGESSQQRQGARRAEETGR